MQDNIIDFFNNPEVIRKIQTKLPKLFQIAELESSRAGKVGMEVGSLRERILVALLIYKLGVNNVITEIPITQAEVDVIALNTPISIKTISNTRFSGVKLIWTVDEDSAMKFLNNYTPHYDLMLVQINWDNIGGLYYIPQSVQLEIFNSYGKEQYIKLPKVGTNPRGVELSAFALKKLVIHPNTCKIPIEWKKETINFNTFYKWVRMWEDN